MKDARASAGETFLVFLKLGLSCFGGPVAHLGYFHEEFVVRRRWLAEAAYADVVALCQFLPGPASSQVGLAIGLHRAGWRGALAAWLGFTLPSAALMIAAAYGLAALGDLTHAGWLAGLKLAAVAVVAQAVWVMGRRFCQGPATIALALLAATAALAWTWEGTQVVAIALGGLAGWIFFRRAKTAEKTEPAAELAVPYGQRLGFVLLGIFFVLLAGLPVLRAATGNPAVASFTAFYEAGSLVFGGGHVVLPLLQAGVVEPGWVTPGQFLAGYGAAQALPGPLFSFAAYLGAMLKPWPHGWVGGLWCLLAIYLPAALLVFGVLPFWERLRREAWARGVLQGTNAVVVGLLLAALYRPVWVSAVRGPKELAVAVAAYVLLAVAKRAPWEVVALCAVAGELVLR